MTHLFSEHFQAVDSNGNPYSGAKLYFYQTATTTPITVYQDSGKIASHTNPVVAGTDGLFAPIYVDTDTYKIALKTSADVTIQTVDPLYAPLLPSSTSPVPFASGTVSLPSITFTGDLDTGIYRIGANNIGVTVNGGKVLDISGTGLGVVGTVLAGNGTVALPAHSFTSDPDTGLYRIGANNLGVAAAGAKVLDVSANGLSVTGTTSSSDVFLAPNGAVGAPSFTFTSDTDTGFYRVGANNPAISAGGTKALDITASSTTFPDGYSLKWSTYTLSGTVAGTPTGLVANTAIGATLLMSSGGLDLTGLSIPPPTLGTGQVKFPAAQNASSDANTLDDYEEGTWTPTMTFNASSTGVTYSAQSGWYVKIGQMVLIYGRITLTSNGSGVGTARIASLPFSSLNLAGVTVPGPSLRLLAGGSAATAVFPCVDSNTTTAALLIPGAVTVAVATDTNITDTASFDFQMVYQAAA
jgi:hypothetical protein